MLAIAAFVAEGYLGAPVPSHVRAAPPICSSASTRFDQCLSKKAVAEAAALLIDDSLELTEQRCTSLLDAACTTTSEGASPPDASDQQRLQAEQQRLQTELKGVYDALTTRGALRGYGTIASTALLPVTNLREVSTEDQLRLTGLPTSAFAPPSGGGRGDVIAGTGSALLLSSICSQLGLDPRLGLAAVGGGLLLDRALLRGALGESIVRRRRRLTPQAPRHPPLPTSAHLCPPLPTPTAPAADTRGKARLCEDGTRA